MFSSALFPKVTNELCWNLKEDSLVAVQMFNIPWWCQRAVLGEKLRGALAGHGLCLVAVFWVSRDSTAQGWEGFPTFAGLGAEQGQLLWVSCAACVVSGILVARRRLG